MKTTLGRSFIAVVVLLAVGSLCALVAFSWLGVAAQSEDLAEKPTVLTAHDLMRAGRVVEGADTCLYILRSLPDSPEAMDEALAPMNLLAFSMCLLMQDDVLKEFLASLDTATYPIDELVLANFYLTFRDYEIGRHMTFVSEEELGALIDELAESPSPLIRMGARVILTRQNWELRTPERIKTATETLNAMAEECPACEVTRQSFREMLRAKVWRAGDYAEETGNDKYAEWVGDFLEDPAWNDNMRKLISEDAVVSALTEVMNGATESGPKDTQDMLGQVLSRSLGAAEKHPDVGVRAWFATSLEPCLERGKGFSVLTEDIRGSFNGAIAAEKQQKAASDTVPVDIFQMQYSLMMWGISQPESKADCAHYADLLAQKRDTDSVNANWFELVPREINYYAHSLINQDKYKEATVVFQQLIDTYPNSELARRSQESIDIIRPFCK